MERRLDSETWQRIEEIFLAVVDSDPTQRENILDSLTGDDAALRAEVESLLAHDHDAALPAVTRDNSLAPPRRKPGMVVTHYRLLYPLTITAGSEVWCGEFVEDQANRVALKFMFDESPRRRERFENEAHLLARLRHPNVAEFLDCGRDEEGQPFIVTKFVAGTPITEHADSKQLSIESRIGLMIRVCDAISYAHQFLIVHRDLKPSNIIVSDDGQPVVLDFGISKELRMDEASSQLALTSTHERPMTPAYASAEQARGEPITTATDVHGLGLVLYELLTGHHPYSDQAHLNAEGLFDRICHSVPRLPSEVVSVESRPLEQGQSVETQSARLIAALRRATPKQLKRQLRRSADAVAMKALAKNPEDRYRSVSDFQNDLVNIVNHRPISVRVERQLLSGAVRRRPIRSLILAGASAAGVAGILSSLVWVNQVGKQRQETIAARAEAAQNNERRELAMEEAARQRMRFEKLQNAIVENNDGVAVANSLEKRADLPEETSPVTVIALARRAAESGDLARADQYLKTVGEVEALGSEDRSAMAAAFAAMGRPTRGLEVMQGIQPSSLENDFRDPLDVQCTMLRLLLDSGQLKRAGQWNEIGVRYKDMPHHARRMLLMAELRKEIGWWEGARELLSEMDDPVSIQMSASQIASARCLAATMDARDAKEDRAVPLLQLASMNDSTFDLALVRCKLLLAAARIEREDKQWKDAEVHLQDAQACMAQHFAEDHHLAFQVAYELAALGDQRDDRDAIAESVEHGERYLNRATEIGELGTVTAGRIGSLLMQRQDDHSKVLSLMDRLAPYRASKADKYVRRNLLQHEFNASLGTENWIRAKKCIEELRPLELELWGADSLENASAIAGQSLVESMLPVSNRKQSSNSNGLETVIEITRKFVERESSVPSIVFLRAVSLHSDSPLSAYEWMRHYWMQHQNDQADQFEIVAYLIEGMVDSHPRTAKVLVVAAIEIARELPASDADRDFIKCRLFALASDLGLFNELKEEVDELLASEDLAIQERAAGCLVLGLERTGKRAEALRVAKEWIGKLDQPEFLNAVVWKMANRMESEPQREQWKSLLD